MLDPMRSCTLSTVLVAALALSSSCAPAPDAVEEPIVLETEDVVPAPDADLDLSGDQVAKRRSESVGGQLPVGFPEGLPVFQPSTIVDIGEGGRGGYVLFETGAPAASVENRLRSALAGAGWSVAAEPGGAMAVARGARSARISISEAGPMTAIRVEY